MQPIRRRGRLSALLAGAVVASSLATAVATTALAPTAGAVNGDPTAVSTACNYRPFDGKWHMADVDWTATPSVTTVLPGGAIALTDSSIETELLPEMAQIGYAAGLLQAGENDIPVEAWVGIESVNATPRFQVVRATGTATTTITPGTGGTVQATPIVAELTLPDTSWTATTTSVSFRPAPSGTVNGQWPNPGSLPGDQTGGIVGGQYVVATLPGADTPFELTLDCYPGTVDIDGVPTADFAAAPFATVGTVVDPEDPEEPEEPEEPEPVDGNWDCISGLGRYRQREIQPMDVAVTFPSVPQVTGSRVVLPKVQVDVELDSALAVLLYQANLIPAGDKTLPLEGWIYLAGSNTVERQQRIKVDTTYTTRVTDPTPEVRNSGDETAQVISERLEFGPVFWTPVSNGDVSFTLAAPNQNNAPKIDVIGRGYADVPYSIRPYGQLFLRAGTVKVVEGVELPNYGANLDCAAATITVADTTIPYHNFGNGVRNPDNNTDPNTGSRGRYGIVADALNVLGTTVYGDPSVNTFDCISGLGRYRGREIEPMNIRVRQPDAPVVSGGRVRIPRTLVDVTVTEGLLTSLYQGNQLVNGVNTEKLFGWVYLNGANTVERTRRLAVETVYQATVNDPTPDNRTNGDETVSGFTQTLDFGSSTWTPVGRGDVTFSLAAPGANNAPKIDVIGKGYADTPYSIRPYGNVFLRAETANYGANLDCLAGTATIADAAIPYHNFGNDPRNPDDNLLSGSRGRYALTADPAPVLSQAVYGNPALNTFDCISGLGRFRGREIEPMNIEVGFPSAPVVSGNSITVPSVQVDVNVTSGLLKSLYAAGQFDNEELATSFTTEQKLEGWVHVEGTNTVEGAQRLYLDGTYEVTIADPTPADLANRDETIAALDEELVFPASTWTANGPSKVSFGLADPNRFDAPKIDVIGTGYADTPYSIRPYGSVFLRAGTDHYGANLDCTPGTVTIADPTIPYHNFGNDPRNTTDNLQSGSRGRYAFAADDVALGLIRTGTANQRFVNLVYQNAYVLGRTSADAGGLATWTKKLDGGATRLTVVGQLLKSTSARTTFVQNEYQRLLGRQPAAVMVTEWNRRFAAGWTREQLLADILGSAEFRTKAGGTNAAVVDAQFLHALNRPASDAERATWAARIQATSAKAVAAQLLKSDSARKATISAYHLVTFGRVITPAELGAYLRTMPAGTSVETMLARIVAGSVSEI